MGAAGSKAPCFTIKQIADLFQITRGAVRFYQEKGLVNPTVADNGYRFYSMDDFFQLLYLKRYAAMSMPLDEVAAHFRSESDESIGSLVEYLEQREEEVRRRVDEETRRLKFLKRFRERMQGLCEGEFQLIESPEYWALGREAIPTMAREEPEVLKDVISLLSKTIIGGVYDLRPPGRCLISELRIEAPAAQAAGLYRSRFFRVLPAARLAVATIRCDLGEGYRSLDEQVVAGFADLARRVEEQGGRAGSLGFSELVLVHQEQGERVEYHALYLAVEDSVKEGFQQHHEKTS